MCSLIVDEPPRELSGPRRRRAADEPHALDDAGASASPTPPRRRATANQRPRHRALDEPHTPDDAGASASTNPGFRQSENPPGTLLRGFHVGQNQFPKPDISAGYAAARVIPGPKPVSTSAILVALLFCQGERATGLVSWSPALRLQVSAPPPAGQCRGDTPRLRSPRGGVLSRFPRPRRRSGGGRHGRRCAHG